MIHWAGSRLFWVLCLCGYALVLLAAVHTLQQDSLSPELSEPSAVRFENLGDETRLVLQYAQSANAPRGGVLLPRGPDAGRLPGLPKAWAEMDAILQKTTVEPRNVGFHATQAISSLAGQASEAIYDLSLSYAVDQVVLVDEVAFLLTNNGDILALDISSSARPQIMQTLQFNRTVLSMVMRDRVLYLLLKDSGQSLAELLLLDVQNPAKSRQIGRSKLPDWSTRLSLLSRQQLLVLIDPPGSKQETVQLFRLTDDHHLVPRGCSDGFNLSANYVSSGPFWFVNNLRYGLNVLDFRNPETPQKIASLDIPEALHYLAVLGDRLFAWGNLDRLYTIDISDPSAPGILHIEEGGTLPVNVLFVGAYTYLLDRKGGLKVFDQSPAMASQVESLSQGEVYRGRILAQPDGNGLLRIVDKQGKVGRNDPDALKTVAHGSLAGTTAIEWWGDELLALSRERTLQLVDVAIGPPKIRSELVLSRACRWVAVSGDYAFLGGDEALFVVERRDGVLLQTTQAAVPVKATFDGLVLDNELYVAAGMQGLLRYSLARPQAPELLPGWTLTRPLAALADFRQLASLGDSLFAAAGPAGLLSGQVDPQGQLQITGALQFETPVKALQTSGKALLVADADEVHVVDMQHPRRWQKIGAIAFEGVTELVVSNAGLWAGHVPERGWRVLPLPRIFRTGEVSPRSEISFTLPAMPDKGVFDVNLFNDSGLIHFPVKYTGRRSEVPL